MDQVTFKCASCHGKLGVVANRWVRIGRTIVSPDLNPEDYDDFDISIAPEVSFGASDTILEECETRRAKCRACKSLLGMECLTAPRNHVIKAGQLLLRESALSFKSTVDGRCNVDPIIHRVHTLRGQEPSTQTREDSPNSSGPGQTSERPPSGVNHDADEDGLAELHLELDAQRETIEQMGNEGNRVVSNFSKALGQVNDEVQQLGRTTDTLRRDCDRGSEDLASVKSDLAKLRQGDSNGALLLRLEDQERNHGKTRSSLSQLERLISHSHDDNEQLQKEVSSMKEQLQRVIGENEELRNELSETRQIAEESIGTAKEYSREVSSLREELKALRQSKDNGHKSRPTPDSSFSSHQLEILANSISKIGKRASHIESLQMDFDLFKSRIQRLEAQTTSTSSKTHKQEGRESNGTRVTENTALSAWLAPNGNARGPKRKSSWLGDQEDHLTSKHVEVVSDDSSTTPTSAPSRINRKHEPAQMSPNTSTPALMAPKLKRTKSGAIDKRSLRWLSKDSKSRVSLGSENARDGTAEDDLFGLS